MTQHTQLPIPTDKCYRCSDGGLLCLEPDPQYPFVDLKCIKCSRTMYEWKPDTGWVRKYNVTIEKELL